LGWIWGCACWVRGAGSLQRTRAPEYFRDLVRNGHLGAKTSRGFYDWSVKSADAVRARRDAFLVEVLRYRRNQS
jgi:3-hydroxyacyl-CoA dehydrogenase